MTHLVVTGPARGRLFNLDSEGPVGPYVVEDIDFLAWYERWLDEIVAGYDVGWFGERLPLDEPELLAVLTDDPSPPRRARAGESLLQQPALGDTAWNALLAAMTSDPDPTVRANCGTNCVGKGTSTGALCPTPKRSRTTSRNTPGRALHAGSTH
ncbi:hypothetical protein BJF79_17690 [Actinomadura sp. CNU-125]|nr:hypothetical protein BJF79_17690 [Actinomadura sp. CNU-125]